MAWMTICSGFRLSKTAFFIGAVPAMFVGAVLGVLVLFWLNRRDE